MNSILLEEARVQFKTLSDEYLLMLCTRSRLLYTLNKLLEKFPETDPFIIEGKNLLVGVDQEIAEVQHKMNILVKIIEPPKQVVIDMVD